MIMPSTQVQPLMSQPPNHQRGKPTAHQHFMLYTVSDETRDPGGRRPVSASVGGQSGLGHQASLGVEALQAGNPGSNPGDRTSFTQHLCRNTMRRTRMRRSFAAPYSPSYRKQTD